MDLPVARDGRGGGRTSGRGGGWRGRGVHGGGRGGRTMRPSIPKGKVDLGIRPGPRAEYQGTCQEPAKRSVDPEIEDTPLRLLVVSLSGILVFRDKRKATRAAAKRAKARPFARALLRYCLGWEERLPTHSKLDDKADKSSKAESVKPESSASAAPASSPAISSSKKVKHDWPSHGPYQVLIWTKAMEHNMEAMLANFLPPNDPLRKRLMGVWGRPTLIPTKLERKAVQETKDLEIVWHKFNLHSDERLLADDRRREDLARPDTEFNGAATMTARQATQAGPWDESNTIMINDDSPRGDKLLLQPHNSIYVHDYGQDEARSATRIQNQYLDGTLEASAGMIQAMDVSLFPKTIVPVLKRSRAMRMGLEFGKLSLSVDEAHDAEANDVLPRMRAWDQVLRLDTTLLQVIGVLEAGLETNHIGRWIHGGGTDDFPDTRTQLRPSRDLDPSKGLLEPDPMAKDMVSLLTQQAHMEQGRDKLYWLVRGVRACAQRGIPLNIKHDVLLEPEPDLL